MKLMGEFRRRHEKLAAAGDPDPAGVALLERYSGSLSGLDSESQ
jgi:hypothetical protein